MEDRDCLRIDVLLATRGLAPSRERARALITAGLVRVNGVVAEKPSQRVRETDGIEIRGDVCPYVSRGGWKLERALKAFQVDVQGMICVDIGASTGGFTDVLLQSGAARVYAVDVGTAQLDPQLRADLRVISMENTNARTLRRGDFSPPPTLGVMDVSFISILKILPALRDVLGDEGRLISLIKPQFEAGRALVGKNGIVSKAETHIKVLRDIQMHARECGWRVRGYDFSPIQGGDGNLEFLADLMPDTAPAESSDIDLRDVVLRAHRELRKKS